MIYQCRFPRIRHIIGSVIIIFFMIALLPFIYDYENIKINVLLKGKYVLIMGILGELISIYLLILLFVQIFRKNPAFVITKDYFIDNTLHKYLGKIYFKDIQNIKRMEKNFNDLMPIFLDKIIKLPPIRYYKIFLRYPVTNKKSLLDKIITYGLRQYNPERASNVIIITGSKLLGCTEEEFEQAIMSGFESARKNKQSN